MFFAFLLLLLAITFALVNLRRPSALLIVATLILAMLIFWHHATDVLQINW